MRQPIKTMAHPLGHRLESHTKTLMEGGFCLESITSAQYRGRLGGGGCFFASFFAPKKVRSCYDKIEKISFERETEIEILL